MYEYSLLQFLKKSWSLGSSSASKATNLIELTDFKAGELTGADLSLVWGFAWSYTYSAVP